MGWNERLVPASGYRGNLSSFGAHIDVWLCSLWGAGHRRNPTPASCWLVTGTDELLSWMNRAGEFQ